MTILNVERFGFFESFCKTIYHLDRMLHKEFNILVRLIPAFSCVPVGTATATDRTAKVTVCLAAQATFFDNQV
jgi:hypothetical protein